jgi:hypothetical protein
MVGSRYIMTICNTQQAQEVSFITLRLASQVVLNFGDVASREVGLN